MLSDQELKKHVACIQGNLITWPEASNTPFVSHASNPPRIIVGFVIRRGSDAIPDTRPFLQFYTREKGKWRLAAESGKDFVRSTFHVYSIDSGVPEEIWIIVAGKGFGDTGSRLKIKVLGFNGVSIRTVWERTNLTGGEVSVSHDHVVVSHFVANSAGRLEEKKEVFHVSKMGLRSQRNKAN